MRTSRNVLALAGLLALAGCGIVDSPAAEKEPVKNGDKSPLAEYLGEGFSSGPGGGMRITVQAGGGRTEEELAKQRKVEEAVAACMRQAGFEYVAVPPEQDPKGKFDDAFNLPPDQFAEQYGYGISTIDWSKPEGEDDGNPNTKIRNGLSEAAKKAYDKALNGDLGDGTVIAAPADGKGAVKRPDNTGCRGKAVDQVYGKGEDKMADFQKFESLFKDLEALRKRIESDQRVVEATTAWSDCLADAGHAGYQRPGDPQTKVQQKLDELAGRQPSQPGQAKVAGPPSFDKVDAQKLAELRTFEKALAKADHACRQKGYDEAYKQVQYEKEAEFVSQNKAQLEQYRDAMAER